MEEIEEDVGWRKGVAVHVERVQPLDAAIALADGATRRTTPRGTLNTRVSSAL